MAIVINGSGTVTGISVGGLPDGIVDAGTLADNAVGLAQMAGGTDGNIITYDTSGNPAVVATGSDGQILTSAGADAVPAFETAAGGIDCDADSWQRTSASTDQDSAAVVDFATSVHLGSNVTESGGVITVGTAGWYLVHFKFANMSASGQNANLYLRKNSSRVLGTVYWQTNTEIPYLGSEATVIIECSASDTLDIYGDGYWYGEANNESHTWFTGVRLGA